MKEVPRMALRPDKQGKHRVAYEKNKKRILKTQPDPMSPVIDHMIPVSKGGHPSAIENLQLAHRTCNRQKSDKMFNNQQNNQQEKKVIGNRNLPQSINWGLYSSTKK